MPLIHKVTQHATSMQDTMEAHVTMSSFVLPRPPCCMPTSQGRGGNPAMHDSGADRAAHDKEVAARDEQKVAAARGR
jgi:hypothetical protein